MTQIETQKFVILISHPIYGSVYYGQETMGFPFGKDRHNAITFDSIEEAEKFIPELEQTFECPCSWATYNINS